VRSGRILRFDEVKGYGFIVPDGGGEDVFVHVNDFLEDKGLFSPGTLVEFEVTEGERGLKAFAVRRLAGDIGSTTAPVRSVPLDDDDAMCDVLSAAEFRQEFTEVLLDGVPELTGAQITKVRMALLGVAKKHGWVED